ncbi:alpha/beta-hydrolase [Aureobasidium pullulans]|uniref:Carboxylic ester hydrolase n=1 Tax=Aureobasidium pullulans TaxID=5580 RepID=A0A4S9PHS3_AURPU|nr:alpha/beta-hydrolase [Aureobasidium pullulans]THZ41633.1 alpha/beta-hydrolase [Aureobasidium pullulans]THZ63699.1 alpha/beta-hydrolase [Aureobasidium pullulans]
MRSVLLTLTAVTAALAAPLDEKRAIGPSAVVKNGTVVGSILGNVDSFKGIPFALPPTGSLRLKPPQSITAAYPSGTFAATGVPKACPQFFSQVDSSDIPSDVLGELLMSPLLQVATNTGEDCLTLNVQRPAGTTSSSKLPVVFWIFGGGFEVGSTQMYDGTPLVSESATLGHPVIYVVVNYRVGGFGWLAGKELQADGSTNLGLRDQRKGLEWVAENIAAFGGDPDKVTIWGESAGAISVYDQMIINGGDNTYNGKALFRGAIMNSGSIVPAVEVSHPKAQAVYDVVVNAAGCSGSSDTLECLRTIDYETFMRAADSVPGLFSYQSIALAYLPRPDPSSSFFPVSPEVANQNGNYAKVPIIAGDQEDEGPLFSLVQSNITTDAQLLDYVASAFPDTPRSVVAANVATYPNDPSAGSPFRTGIFNNIYPQYKRLAALFGDAVFNLRRRQLLYTASSVVPMWSYLDSHLYGTAVLGTFHGSDLLAIFFGTGGITTQKTYLDYYTSFINYLDPNAIGSGAPLISWPQYNTTKPTLLQLQAVGNNLLPDTYRSASFQALQANVGSFRT